jgi:phage portal protein BeeE
MGLFTPRKTAAMATSTEPDIKAAVGYNAGASQIGNYYAYIDGDARQRAMSVPAISRARDLIASMFACLPLEFYRLEWDGEEMRPVELAPRAWGRRMSRSATNNFLMAWTFDDLFFYGRAFWHVRERGADGFPVSWDRLPAAMVTTLDQAGPVWFGESRELLFNGLPLDPNDVVQFLSPIQGICYMSPQAINTAIRLEQAAHRNAASAIPAGVLRQVGGEPLSAQELSDMAHAFNEARLTNQTAALNEFLTYEPTTATPDKMTLVESREFQALEIARLANCPPWLLGISVGGYTYQNATMAKQDLYLFAAKNFIECWNQTMSADNVLPRGTYVRLDVDAYLVDMETNEYETADRIAENNREETLN